MKAFLASFTKYAVAWEANGYAFVDMDRNAD